MLLVFAVVCHWFQLCQQWVHVVVELWSSTTILVFLMAEKYTVVLVLIVFTSSIIVIVNWYIECTQKNRHRNTKGQRNTETKQKQRNLNIRAKKWLLGVAHDYACCLCLVLADRSTDRGAEQCSVIAALCNDEPLWLVTFDCQDSDRLRTNFLLTFISIIYVVKNNVCDKIYVEIDTCYMFATVQVLTMKYWVAVIEGVELVMISSICVGR